MNAPNELLNYINGQWKRSAAADSLPVHNPASNAIIATVALSPAAEVDEAVRLAQAAFPGWRSTPVVERVQPLFRLKMLLEENLDAIARIITNECGKTYAESVGEMRRGIENVETACGMPSLIQGYNNEDIASGIDEPRLAMAPGAP